MGKGLREIWAYSKMQKQRQDWKSEKTNKKVGRWSKGRSVTHLEELICRAISEGRPASDSARVIFNPLSLVCFAGEAAKVLLQGAQLSQQLSIFRLKNYLAISPLPGKNTLRRGSQLELREVMDQGTQSAGQDCEAPLTVAAIIKQKWPGMSFCGLDIIVLLLARPFF